MTPLSLEDCHVNNFIVNCLDNKETTLNHVLLHNARAKNEIYLNLECDKKEKSVDIIYILDKIETHCLNKLKELS